MKTDLLGQRLFNGDTVITSHENSSNFIRGEILVLFGKMAACNFGKHTYMVRYNTLIKVPKNETDLENNY